MRNSVHQFQSRENQKSAPTTRWIANATVALLPVLACFLDGAFQKWEEGVALLLFGGQTFERFHLRDFITAGTSTNFRWRIFHDTFRLVRNSPWCGIGFGNFESIFAIFRDASLGDPRALHPESDWFWLWTTRVASGCAHDRWYRDVC